MTKGLHRDQPPVRELNFHKIISGAMITPKLNSSLMEEDYNSFKTMVLVMQAIFTLAFIFMYFFGKRLPTITK